MASHTSLRQASRIVQSERSHLISSRLRQSSCVSRPNSLLSSRSASISRHPRIYSHHALQQTRNLSWWGSGASSSQNTPSDSITTSSNLNIAEPSDLRSTIAPDRSFKASPNISSAELSPEAQSTPNSVEPQFIADVQQAVAEPHLSDPSSTPANLEDIPERMGYLKEVCGLDFGWGPTSTVQYVLELLHINGGYTWTASIMLLGLAVRGMVFPALIGAAKEAQKMRDMKDVIGPIQKDYTAAKEKQDQLKMSQAAQRLTSVRKEFGLKLWKSFLPLLLQIPFGFGCWRLLRNSAELPVPGFITESWLWTSDLTFSDPYFIAPLASAGLIFLTITTNGRTNAMPNGGSILWLMKYVMPVATMAFMSIQPGAVQLYFVSSSAMGLLSALILQRPYIRALFNMPPLAPPQPSALPPIRPKATGSAAAASPASSSTTVGGLQRHSVAARRQIESDRAAQLQAQNTAPGARRSIVDRFVDGVKDFKKTGGYHVGQVRESLGSRVDNKKARAQAEHMEEYEARIKAKLDQRRNERNKRVMGGR